MCSSLCVVGIRREAGMPTTLRMGCDIEPSGEGLVRMGDRDVRSDGDSAVLWICRLARIGWLSKGFVFIVIGVLAIQIALTDWNGGNADADADQEGAWSAWVSCSPAPTTW
jgi:hypothetical protein